MKEHNTTIQTKRMNERTNERMNEWMNEWGCAKETERWECDVIHLEVLCSSLLLHYSSTLISFNCECRVRVKLSLISSSFIWLKVWMCWVLYILYNPGHRGFWLTQAFFFVVVVYLFVCFCFVSVPTFLLNLVSFTDRSNFFFFFFFAFYVFSALTTDDWCEWIINIIL